MVIGTWLEKHLASSVGELLPAGLVPLCRYPLFSLRGMATLLCKAPASDEDLQAGQAPASPDLSSRDSKAQARGI